MATFGPSTPRTNERTWATLDLSTAANGLSGVINMTGCQLAAIQMPTGWTDAALQFYTSVDGTTANMMQIYDTAGGMLTYLTSANRVLAFDPAVLQGVQYLQIASATTAGVAVAQAATRTFKLGLNWK